MAPRLKKPILYENGEIGEHVGIRPSDGFLRWRCDHLRRQAGREETAIKFAYKIYVETGTVFTDRLTVFRTEV
jgi:hypothetical protein